MSASFGSSSSQDVDLNITPIIDCFTVLITFLLASASFLSIGFFEASTPGSAADPSAQEPNVEAVVRLKGNHLASFELKGKKNLSFTINLEKKEDLQRLQDELKNVETEKLQLSSILLSAEDSVDYKSVTEMMEQLNRTPYPVIVGEF